MRKVIILLVFLIISLQFSSCTGPDKDTDLILINGTVYTVDEKAPRAQAVAVSGDLVQAVGTNEEISRLATPKTRIIDLKGRALIPGFNEGHAHYKSLGHSLSILPLGEARNWAEIVQMVADAVKQAQPGSWILGRGWHQDKWQPRAEPNVDGYPFHDLLSEASPDNPVYLTHASGHAIIANDLAMKTAGITGKTTDPEGGTILHKPSGEPAGVFLENADMLIIKKYAEYLDQLSPAEKQILDERKLVLANQACLANGITTFQDAGATIKEVNVYKKMIDEEKIDVRLWVMLEDDNQTLRASIAQNKIIGYGNHQLTVRAIKRYMDGALGAHGAWLFEPYLDRPQSTGLNTTPIDELAEIAMIAEANDFQLCVHAIGDRGNRETLDIYEKVFQSGGAKKDRRWRIEHAQHLHPDDIPRFAELGVIAAMQTVHATSDGPWIPDRLGEERSRTGAYVWRDLIQSGAIIANGTDAPVERINPFENFYSAVTRRMANGEAFYANQALTREEALKSYTLMPAYAAFEEDIKGSITPGKLADLVVLSHDIMTIPEQQIPRAKVLYTFIGGKIVYQSDQPL